MIFYNVKNLATGKIVTMTKLSKDLIFKFPANQTKYELIEECDQNGRAFNYNNFLTKANESRSIGITEEKESCENANGGNDRIEIGPITNIEPIDIKSIGGNAEDNSNQSKSEDNTDSKPKRIKSGKGKRDI